MMADESKSAFPSTSTGNRGLTYREWLVGQAINGLCANSGDTMHADVIAKAAIAVADAVLEEESK